MKWLSLFLLLACGSTAPAETCQVPLDLTDFDSARVTYPLLSQVCVLNNPEAVPYEINTPLFSDYTAKERTIWMPPGTAAVYAETAAFEFPVGTIITKTFIENERRIETRLLVHGTDGWFALPYVWNDTGDAALALGGSTQRFTIAGVEATYKVPNANQCAQCHALLDRAAGTKALHPIGPTARSLNRDGQLQAWAAAGKLNGLPEAAPALARWDDPARTVEERARAWLEINCAHCHRFDGEASNTGLYLLASETDPTRLGVCKGPVAAGQGAGDHKAGIVPGKPDDSILVYRIESVKANEMMPELGRSVVHKEGVALVRQWISEMQGACP